MNNKKKAFTLAEVLIVIGIIGIIATLVIPSLVTDVMNDVYNKNKDLVMKKITEATNQMKTNGKLSGYADTESFVNEFKKYMKIAQVCTSSELTKCFPSSFVNDKKTYSASTYSTGSAMGNSAFTTPNLGLVLADGTSVIMGYNPNCATIDWWNNSTSTTSCLAMLYDVNGKKGPNIVGKDIGTLNVTFCIMTLGMCVSPNDVTYTPYGQIYINPFMEDYYWAGADKACTDMGMKLPNPAELRNVIDFGYTALGITNGTRYWTSGLPGTELATACYLNGTTATCQNILRCSPVPKLRCIK